MTLPFTPAQFDAVFARYNAAIWPAQAVAIVLGAAIVLWAWTGRSRPVAAGLALMWGWTGLAYHAAHFSAINPAAWAFAALFVVQALLLGRHAASRAALRLQPPAGVRGVLAVGLIAYAMLLYPLIGRLGGHAWDALPMFGVTPCPVTLFTFGVLLLCADRVPMRLLVVPVLWSLIGGSAAWLLHVPQDGVLLVAWIAALPFLLQGHAPRRPPVRPAEGG